MRRQLLVRKWEISEELRRRTHSSSVESPLVEVEQRFLVWMCRGMCDHVRWLFLVFCNACESCSRGKSLLASGVDHSTYVLIHNIFLSASFHFHFL